jgi:ribosome maturation factor RimP
LQEQVGLKPLRQALRPGTSVAAAAAAVGAGPDLHGAVERTVAALGYDLVDLERSARGLLRVTIDRLPGRRYGEGPGAEGESVTVDDCEAVTRQLQAALEVDGIDYQRLEVSSPGLDRPLKRPADYQRFAGQAVDLTLKSPFQGRRHWRGVLAAGDDGWRLLLDGGRGGTPGQALDFSLGEVREARLVPVIDFRGRGRKAASTGS